MQKNRFPINIYKFLHGACSGYIIFKLFLAVLLYCPFIIVVLIFILILLSYFIPTFFWKDAMSCHHMFIYYLSYSKYKLTLKRVYIFFNSCFPQSSTPRNFLKSKIILLLYNFYFPLLFTSLVIIYTVLLHNQIFSLRFCSCSVSLGNW